MVRDLVSLRGVAERVEGHIFARPILIENVAWKFANPPGIVVWMGAVVRPLGKQQRDLLLRLVQRRLGRFPPRRRRCVRYAPPSAFAGFAADGNTFASSVELAVQQSGLIVQADDDLIEFAIQ